MARTASDPEGDALTGYLWTFGSAGTSTSSASPVSQAFNIAGTYAITLKVTDSHGGTFTTAAQNLSVASNYYPTSFSGSGSGCQGFLCLSSRYIDFTWSVVPQVNAYEMRFSESNVLCSTPGNFVVNSGTTTTARVSVGCITSATYSVQIRARDSVTNLWSDWRPAISVTT